MLPHLHTGAVNPAKDAGVGLAEDAAVVLAADITAAGAIVTGSLWPGLP